MMDFGLMGNNIGKQENKMKLGPELLDEILREKAMISELLHELAGVADKFIASENEDMKENRDLNEIPQIKKFLGSYAAKIESTLKEKQEHVTKLMVALIHSEKDWDQVQWMQGRLSSLNASVNNVRLTWRRIAKPYVQLDARVERRLDDEVRRYRESAMRERKLAEEEAAMTTPNAQEQGDTEGPGELSLIHI